MRLVTPVLVLAAAAGLAFALAQGRPAEPPAAPHSPAPAGSPPQVPATDTLAETAAFRAVSERTRQEDERIYAALTKPLPEITFDQTPFDQVMQFLAEMAKVNLVVDWLTMENAGYTRDVPVTLNITNLPLERVLRQILDAVGDETRLAYEIHDGVLQISTDERIAGRMVTRTYPVADLLRLEARRLQRLHNAEIDEEARTAASDLANATNPEFRERSAAQAAPVRRPIEREDVFLTAAAECLMDVLRQTVVPDSWRETGGGEAVVTIFGDMLIIRQSRNAHRDIARLLADMRQATAAQAK
ncbi:MAG: hypothetical protein AB1716_09050 [Planctomycetota bacterium]